VVAFNSVRNFHDGIDHHVYGLPDGYPNTPRDRMPVANDIYNNDISNMHDDCIESDGIVFNARILRNRCINAAGSGVSLQPIFAGPAYFIGNIVHHVPGNFAALKFAGSAGAVVYHNTFDVALRTMVPTSNAHFLNNLILAEFPDEPAFALATNTQYSSSDYNGFMPGDQAPAAFSWSAPAAGVSADYLGKPVERRFGTLAEYRQATGQDMHSILVTRDIFRNVPAAEVTALTRVYDPDSFDFRLKPGSKAVDAGVLLPNVNDNFKGRAPDLGALEVGAVAPHYGPRPPH
jgi:hypothetical protein